MSEINEEYKNKDTIFCPNCGKIYSLIEYERLKNIGNLENLYNAHICYKCGTAFSGMRIISENIKKGTVGIIMDVDLVINKE